LIFTGYTGSKHPVRNRLKIQFTELDFSKLIFQKSSTDQQGASIALCKIMVKISITSFWSFAFLSVKNQKEACRTRLVIKQDLLIFATFNSQIERKFTLQS
jgi:hypothetical protein